VGDVDQQPAVHCWQVAEGAQILYEERGAQRAVERQAGAQGALGEGHLAEDCGDAKEVDGTSGGMGTQAPGRAQAHRAVVHGGGLTEVQPTLLGERNFGVLA
jgi:hypothetical protein